MSIEITTASPAILSSIRLALSESYNSIPSTSSIQPFVGNNTADGIFSAVLGGQNNDTNGLPDTFIIGSNIVASTSGFTFVENLSSLGVVCDSNGNSNTWNNTTTFVQGNSAAWNSTYTNAITSVQPGSNITATVTNNVATIGLNNNVAVNDLTVLGTLYTPGSSTQTNISTLNIDSTFIYLASGNPTDNYDIGILGNYNDGIKKYTGLARNHNDKSWTLFSGLTSKPLSTSNVLFPVTDPTFKTDTLNANINSNQISTSTLTATSIVATNFIDYVGGNNNKWNSAYSTVNSNSATTWNYQGTDLKQLSSGWVGGSSAYTTVNNNSANWNIAYNTSTSYQTASSSFLTSIPSSLSSNWQSTYATVSALSSKWVGGNDAYTNLVTNSSAYLSAVNLSFLSVSGNWNSVYSTVSSNSATTWNYQGTDLKQLSSGWVGGNSAYTTVNSNSATTWNYQGTDLKQLSSGWVGGNSAYTTVNSNSATTWNYQGTDLKQLSANWQTAYATASTLSISNGNIGIGTSTPNSKLTVVGDISASGTLYGLNQPAISFLASGGSNVTNVSEINFFNAVDTLASNSTYEVQYIAILNTNNDGSNLNYTVSGNNTFTVLGALRMLYQENGGGLSCSLVAGNTGNRSSTVSVNIGSNKLTYSVISCLISTTNSVKIALGATTGSNPGTPASTVAGSYKKITRIS